jgi:hypothetical protein
MRLQRRQGSHYARMKLFIETAFAAATRTS